MNATLNAATIARAFEVMLPAREDGLTLMHNPHLDMCSPREDGPGDTMYVAEYLRAWGRNVEFIGPFEQQKCEETQELWILCWTPANGTKETRLAAATLTALAQWLQDNSLAFGS